MRGRLESDIKLAQHFLDGGRQRGAGVDPRHSMREIGFRHNVIYLRVQGGGAGGIDTAVRLHAEPDIKFRKTAVCIHFNQFWIRDMGRLFFLGTQRSQDFVSVSVMSSFICKRMHYMRRSLGPFTVPEHMATLYVEQNTHSRPFCLSARQSDVSLTLRFKLNAGINDLQ